MALHLAIIGLGVVGGGWLVRKYLRKQEGKKIPVSNAVGVSVQGKEQNPPASTIPWPPEESWVDFEYKGDKYKVSPTYIAPIGIGEAVDMAKENNLVLPTPDMVKAIWEAADLKVEPHPMQHDGTERTMNSRELADEHRAFIQSQIEGKKFSLLGGTHKDVVFIDTAFGKPVNKPGIYGWQHTNGVPIQQEMWGHSLTWKDYSQGLRLIKKV